MGYLKMYRLLIVLLLCLDFHNPTEARHLKEPPSLILTGVVTIQNGSSRTNHFIPGATFASELDFQQEAKNDTHGESKLHLPFRESNYIKKIGGGNVTQSQVLNIRSSKNIDSFQGSLAKLIQEQLTPINPELDLPAPSSTIPQTPSLPQLPYLPSLPSLPPLPQLPPLPRLPEIIYSPPAKENTNFEHDKPIESCYKI